jgi:hypothetical protein
MITGAEAPLSSDSGRAAVTARDAERVLALDTFGARAFGRTSGRVTHCSHQVSRSMLNPLRSALLP